VTDSSDPKAQKSSRKKHAREPATIDLKATVLDDGAKEADATKNDAQENAQDNAWQNVRPEETIITEPETVTAAAPEDMMASSEVSLDSGAGTDSIAPEAAESETASRDDRFETVPPQAPPPERRSSAAGLIGSGVLGGLVGAGLVYGLQVWQQPMTVQDDQRIAQLEQRVSALGQGGGNGQPVDLQPIEGRLQALESARGPIDQRIQQVQGLAENAAARAEEALNRPQAEPAPAPQNDAALTDLSNRLAALENQLRTEVQNAAGAVSSVQGSVQSLDQRVGEQDQRLAALSQQVTENSRGVENASQTSVRVVLSERLGDALRSGTPYADLLDALRKNGASAERLAALEPFAQSGAPTANDLLNRYEPLEAAILRDERAASGDWSDRLLRMMDKVVTVRPVNEPGATGVPSTLARIRQSLAQGDMGGAAAAWNSLPEPARRMSEEWGKQVTALAGAQQASRELSAESLAALNRSTQ
jgi:hypothetical protein